MPGFELGTSGSWGERITTTPPLKADVRVIADFIDGIKVKLELENDYISMKSVAIPNSSIIQHNGKKQ